MKTRVRRTMKMYHRDRFHLDRGTWFAKLGGWAYMVTPTVEGVKRRFYAAIEEDRTNGFFSDHVDRWLKTKK